LLCNQIESKVEEESFKSEAYLQIIKEEGESTARGRMYLAHMNQNGPFICVEVKLAITLCMMAGGSYLDLEMKWYT